MDQDRRNLTLSITSNGSYKFKDFVEENNFMRDIHPTFSTDDDYSIRAVPTSVLEKALRPNNKN